MSREAEYKPELICDNCGHQGAFDFYGDYICHNCLDLEQGDEDGDGEFDEE